MRPTRPARSPHSSARASFVRSGIAVYGVSPGTGRRPPRRRPAPGDVAARPGLVRQARAGGHGDLLRAAPHASPSATTIATLPIGYADGVPRRLHAVGGEVLLGGRRRPIVGAITMDQLMVDCGDDEVSVGDEAVLIGAQGDERITATEWADRLDTIGYEIVCGISARIERRYTVVVARSSHVACWRSAPRRSPARMPSPRRSPGWRGAGDIIVLAGEMGAGKTAFAQGFGAALGVDRADHLADVQPGAQLPAGPRRPAPRRRVPPVHPARAGRPRARRAGRRPRHRAGRVGRRGRGGVRRAPHGAPRRADDDEDDGARRRRRRLRPRRAARDHDQRVGPSWAARWAALRAAVCSC